MANEDEPAESPEEAQTHTMERLRAMFAASGTGAYDESGVVCPFCDLTKSDGVSYVHMDWRINHLGNDHYDASRRYGVSVRGDVTALTFWCAEGGHRWVLAFGAHKAGLVVRVGRLPDEESV
jgi:hypothetical protein